MKISDAPTTQAEIEIHAPAEKVWQIVSDIQTPALTSSEFQGADWLDGATEAAVGARFRGRNAHKAIGEWATTCIVTVVDAPNEFAYAVENVEDPSAVWRYLIKPSGDGVSLTQIAQIGPGPSGLSPAIERMPEKETRIIERRLSEHHANMTANLAEIKKLAEGQE